MPRIGLDSSCLGGHDAANPFAPIAFYATKRRRSEWLALDDEQLGDLVHFHTLGKPMTLSTGRWPTG